jgi:hypothetical protein
MAKYAIFSVWLLFLMRFFSPESLLHCQTHDIVVFGAKSTCTSAGVAALVAEAKASPPLFIFEAFAF